MPHYRVRFGSTQCGKIPAPVYIPGVFAVGCCGIATVHGARQFELRAGSSLLRISSPHDGRGPPCWGERAAGSRWRRPLSKAAGL